jgi:uncharacterized coiled-coil protein SlyX
MADTESAGQGSPSPLERRLTRVEEELGFTGHALERLAEGVSDLSARLERAISRLEALERRLGRLESPAEASGDGDGSEQE